MSYNQQKFQREFVKTYTIKNKKGQIQVSFLKENNSLNARSSVLIKVSDKLACKVARLPFTSLPPIKEYFKIPLEKMFPGYEIPYELQFSNDGQLYAITNPKSPYGKQKIPLNEDPYPLLRVFYGQGNNIKTFDLNERWFNVDYKKIYRHLCQSCQYDQKLKQQILSTLIGLRWANAKIRYNPNNYTPITDYSSFLSAIIRDSQSSQQKQDILNKVIQYGAATPQERGIATEWLKYLTNQQQLQQQQPYPFNQNMINQYNNNKQIIQRRNYNVAQNMQQNALPTKQQQVNWIKWCQLPYPHQNYIIRYGNSNGQNYFSLHYANNWQMVLHDRCNNFFKFDDRHLYTVSDTGMLFFHDGSQLFKVRVSWTPIRNYQQNNFNNMNERNECMIKRNDINNFGNNNQNFNNIQRFERNIQISNQTVVFKWQYNANSKKLVSLSLDGTNCDCQLINNGGDHIVDYNGVFYNISYNDGCIKICKYGNNTPLATINASTGYITVNNQNPQVNNNNFGNNQNKNNSNFNQQNFQQQLAPEENQVLSDIQQFYNNPNIENKFQIICSYYQGNNKELNEIQKVHDNAKNSINVLNDFYNKKYAKHSFQQCNANFWKQLVSKWNPNDQRTGVFKSFLEDAGYEHLACFLDNTSVDSYLQSCLQRLMKEVKDDESLEGERSPFISTEQWSKLDHQARLKIILGEEREAFMSIKQLSKLDRQARLKIMNETLNRDNLQPLLKYKKYFHDIRFLNFLFWYAEQKNLPDKPNSCYLAKLFGGCRINNWQLEQKRCDILLNKTITVINGSQSYHMRAIDDKITAYCIGYILFSDDRNTQYFGRLPALEQIFPLLEKSINDFFGQQNNWFPEDFKPLVGGVEICQPKPVDEDVKKCLDKLSKDGVNQLGNEYQVEMKNEKTIIRKDNKLIFEGTLSKDGKGLKEGALVIKYNNQDQPDECYEGQFKGVQMHGNGTYVFAKRFPGQKKHEAYKGQFKDGQMHGSGTYYTADGFSAEITYNNGFPINVKNAKDRSDTDVIVFDFFGFGSEAFEDNKHGGRYNSSFFITDNRSYQYKREKIFKLKDYECLPILTNVSPSESQQKATEFIKTHLLIQGVDHYTKLFDEKELRKIQGFDLDKTMQEFGAGQPQFRSLSQLQSQEAKEKWLCFVIDEIGPDAFNKLYLEDNINYYFNNIQRNTDKKLKIVLNIHGTPQLGMSFGPKMEGNKEKFALINKVFQKAASLGRDMYVSNNSCFGSQFLDDKQDIFKQMGVDIFENKADFKPIITNDGINESIDEIKRQYGSTDNFLNICKLKAEADSWRLTKSYTMIKNEKDLLTGHWPLSLLKDFFVNTFNNYFKLETGNNCLVSKEIFGGKGYDIVNVEINSNVNGTCENIDFLQKIEKITTSDRELQPFNKHMRAFFDFVKKKLFVGDNLDQLTEEGKKIEAVIEAQNKIVDDITEQEKIDNNKIGTMIDGACKKLEGFLNDNDRKQIKLLKEEIGKKFDSNGKLEPWELRNMLSKVDLFNSHGTTNGLIKKFEDEFVKEKMQGKLDANNMTLEQLDKFGDTKVNEMLGHLSTSIWLTRSFLLGGVLSKEMGVDKILEGFREKCYQLLYKFGDQKIDNNAIQGLQFELQKEVEKIKEEIATKIEKYVTHINMDNLNSVNHELQELKNKILEDNYYTQQLTSKQIEELKQQQFNFDKKNLVNFLRLLPGKINASMKKANDNIVDYCENIKNNNKQNIKDLLKQLKNNTQMQNKHIIYSANMTGMTPSYMFEMVDSEGKRSNRNLGKMYYEVKNGQIEPLVKNKQEYEAALREFENQLANTEKRESTNDTPGLEGVKFHDFDDIERIQNEEIMKFVKEGKQNKNKLMGWNEVERNDFNYISNAKPGYALVTTKIGENKENNNNNQPKVPIDSQWPRAIQCTPMYSNVLQSINNTINQQYNQPIIKYENSI